MIELLAIAGIVGTLLGTALGATIASRCAKGLPPVPTWHFPAKPPEPEPDAPLPRDERFAT